VTKQPYNKRSNYNHTRGNQGRVSTYEPDGEYPPKLLFSLVSAEVKKYELMGQQHQDYSKIQKLAKGVEELDVKLKQVKDSSDLVRLFGEQEAAKMLYYHVATNGSIRGELKRIVARIPTLDTNFTANVL
jgi:hypothetical protein